MRSLKANAHYIEVSAEVRYWQDKSINGVEDAGRSPALSEHGAMWALVIRLSDGEVVHYAVCDQAPYWLRDETGRRIAQWGGGSSPACILPQQGRNGDSILCQIGSDGHIVGWKSPEIDPDEWDMLLQPEADEAKPVPPTCWVRQNPGFNSGVAHMGPECPPGWVGGAQPMWASPKPVIGFQEGGSQPADEEKPVPPTCWVRQNPGFNSGAAHMGPECPPGWVGSAQPMWASPQPVIGFQEGGSQPEAIARFPLKDQGRAMSKAEMRKLFEATALARHYPLDAVELDGVFDHYTNDDTDRLWVGFALGLRCAERLSSTQE